MEEYNDTDRLSSGKGSAGARLWQAQQQQRGRRRTSSSASPICISSSYGVPAFRYGFLRTHECTAHAPCRRLPAKVRGTAIGSIGLRRDARAREVPVEVLALQRGVPVVFDRVVRSAGQHLCDHCEARTML